MITECPHCGKPIHGSKFRNTLIGLADGTRTNQELVKLTGRKKNIIRTTLSFMRDQGYDVKAKPR